MLEVPTTETQLERIRMAMQADPILSQLKHQIVQGWPDARKRYAGKYPPFEITGMSYW